MTIFSSPLKSSMLTSCSYDNETKELSVTFTNGKDYIYQNVEQQVYDDLINAQSPGKYFNSIKNGLVQI